MAGAGRGDAVDGVSRMENGFVSRDAIGVGVREGAELAIGDGCRFRRHFFIRGAAFHAVAEIIRIAGDVAGGLQILWRCDAG